MDSMTAAFFGRLRSNSPQDPHFLVNRRGFHQALFTVTFAGLDLHPLTESLAKIQLNFVSSNINQSASANALFKC